MTFFGFAFCFEVFLPFDRQGQYFLFLTTMPFFHGAAAAAAAAKSLQSCPTLWDPTDGSPPDSTIPGILQARTLEWVAISFSIHGATEFLYKKLWFIILKRLVVNYFFLFKLWLICLLQLPILRVQFIPPSLVSLIDFVYFLLFLDFLTVIIMATHSSVLAWRIPGMVEPSGLPSMGLYRVGHDWVTSLSLFTFMHWRRK